MVQPTATTSGAATFNLDFSEIAEEAFERCGSEIRSGYDFVTARRSLNLLFMEWANRGINLWTVEEGQIPLVAGTATYDLPLDTVDLLDHVIRTGTGTLQTDITITRISGSTYSSIPNKTTTGRPIQLWVDRQAGYATASAAQAVVWPVPDAVLTYTLVYWRLRRIQDAGTGANIQDIPFRFMPALIAGLAYYLSMKVPGAEIRTAGLKAVYDEQWSLAAAEDRDKSSVRLVPRQTFLR